MNDDVFKQKPVKERMVLVDRRIIRKQHYIEAEEDGKKVSKL